MNSEESLIVKGMEAVAAENRENMTRYGKGYAILARACASEVKILTKVGGVDEAALVIKEQQIYERLAKTIRESRKLLGEVPLLESGEVAFALLEKEHALLEELLANRREMLKRARQMMPK